MRNRLLMIATMAWAASWLGGCIVVDSQDQYTRCSASADCRGFDKCVDVATANGAGTMCTSLRCIEHVDCDLGFNGTSGACLNILGSGGNLCYESCSADTDCTQTDWFCNDTTAGVAICLPGAVSTPPPLLSDYERCGTTAECISGLACAEVTTATAADSMCTVLDCVGDSECGFGLNDDVGACLNILGSGGNVCYERCVVDGDCTGAGWTCSDAVDGVGSLLATICLPF